MTPRSSHAFLVTLLLLQSLAKPSLCAPGPGQVSAARREDVPYIRCQVCQLLAKNSFAQVQQMVKSATSAVPVTEERVLERIEKLAHALYDEGEWIARIDLVEEGDRLVVREMEEVGVCSVECRTVAWAAQDILDRHDTDIAEALFVGKRTQEQFTRWLCHELTNCCRRAPPPLPKERTPGPEFKPTDAEKRRIERLTAEGSPTIPRQFKDNLDTDDLDEEDMTEQQRVDAAVRKMEQLNARAAQLDPKHARNERRRKREKARQRAQQGREGAGATAEL